MRTPLRDRFSLMACRKCKTWKDVNFHKKYYKEYGFTNYDIKCLYCNNNNSGPSKTEREAIVKWNKGEVMKC